MDIEKIISKVKKRELKYGIPYLDVKKSYKKLNLFNETIRFVLTFITIIFLLQITIKYNIKNDFISIILTLILLRESIRLILLFDCQFSKKYFNLRKSFLGIGFTSAINIIFIGSEIFPYYNTIYLLNKCSNPKIDFIKLLSLNLSYEDDSNNIKIDWSNNITYIRTIATYSFSSKYFSEFLLDELLKERKIFYQENNIKTKLTTSINFYVKGEK